MDDGSKDQHYDIGVDLGIPIHVEEYIQPNNEMDDMEYRTKMRLLNPGQLTFLYEVLQHVKTSDSPIYRFLSGGAGVGKTFLLKMLYQSLLKFFNRAPGIDPSLLFILLLAPTGKAAYLLKEKTIHSALKVPINQSREFKTLDSDRLNTLRTQLEQVRFIFIDEVSMVGSGLLAFVDARLKEVFFTSKSFGGKSVIACGDLFQLRPVCDSPIFQLPRSAYGALATNLWQDLFKMCELTQIMRQENMEFAQLLNRLREGKHTENDVAVLKTRVTENLPLQCPHLYLSNSMVNSHNNRIYEEPCAPKQVVYAHDTVVGNMSPDLHDAILARIPKDPAKTMQLHSPLNLAEGLQYDVSINTRTEDGLTNGASCVLKCIKTKGTKPSGVLWVAFAEGNIGQMTRQENKRLYRSSMNIERLWTPILPTTRQFSVGKSVQVLRTQFALLPSTAKTLHRCQGDTIRKDMLVDFKGRTQPHIHYVAISRADDLEHLYLRNFDPKKITVSKDVAAEMNRLRVENTQAPPEDPPHCLKICYLNAQSLHCHLNDVNRDPRLATADLLFCSETRFQKEDQQDEVNLMNFTHLIRHDEGKASEHRPFHGMACFSKTRQPVAVRTEGGIDGDELRAVLGKSQNFFKRGGIK